MGRAPHGDEFKRIEHSPARAESPRPYPVMAPKKTTANPKVPRPHLPPLPDNSVVSAAREVTEKLQQAGHEAYFVGGFVRDWLLGIEHYDVDVATSARPEQIEKLFGKTREVGARFGVVLVIIDHVPTEVATFRTDGVYSDFRRPDEITYGTLEDDAARRDFTVNAIYYDPVAKRLFDFHAGTLDLRRRVLRTVGPAIKRFGEDALRLMRAVRFATHYALEIEPRTLKAIIRKAPLLAEISKERVGEELIRILTGPHPGRAFKLMSELCLWPHIAPEIEALKGAQQGKIAHPEGDVFDHTALVLDNLPENPPPALALAALLHDIAKPQTLERDEEGSIHFYGHQKLGAEVAEQICRRLRLSNELIDQTAQLVENHMRFMHVREMKPSTLKRFVGRPDFQLHLDLHRADSLGSHGDLDAYEYCIERRRELATEHGESMKPEPLARGGDLIAMGLTPGPAFSLLLDELHDEQLEGHVKDRTEALKFLKRRVKELESAEVD